MLDLIGVIYMIMAIVDCVVQNGSGNQHLIIGVLFIICSTLLKLRSDTVKISNYIGKRIKEEQKKDEDTVHEMPM